MMLFDSRILELMILLILPYMRTDEYKKVEIRINCV